VASPAYLIEIEVNPVPCIAPEGNRREAVAGSSLSLAAVCIEFVTNGLGAAQAGSAISEAVEEVLGAVPGFAGCLVLVADEEKRLVTLIAFWGGAERLALTRNSAPWIHKAIAPYLEHCLREGWFHTSGRGVEFGRAGSNGGARRRGTEDGRASAAPR